MSRKARRTPRKRRGLWSFFSRLFGTPKGRHVAGAPSPAPPRATKPEAAARAEDPAPEATPTDPGAIEAAPVAETPIADFTPQQDPVAAAVEASVSAAVTPAGLATVRLIFSDGSVVALSERSVEERQAQYLARGVLEAGGRG